MAIGGKGQSILWLNPSMLPISGNVGIQLGTLKYSRNGISVVECESVLLVSRLALCNCGTQGKGTLCTYPSLSVQTPPFSALGCTACGSSTGEFFLCR
jgi:hypothetical protein